MAYRTEVKSLRTGEWIPLDEWRATEGERPLTHSQYERCIVRSHPILRTREFRIVEFEAKPMRTLFTLRV